MLLFIQQIFDTIMGVLVIMALGYILPFYALLCGRITFVLKYQYGDRQGLMIDAFKIIWNMKVVDL